MNRKKLKTLVLESYKDDILDFNKVYSIANFLTRSELKQYINQLKDHENKKNVVVFTSFAAKDRGFEKLFPNKKIVYKEDPSLMVGIKVVDNDNVYEFNLKNTLDNIISYIT